MNSPTKVQKKVDILHLSASKISFSCKNYYLCSINLISMRTLELLAPAKNYEIAVDAIDCGADAVYMGAASFGARAAATNRIEDIARTVEYAHRYGVRVYATLNTLLFDDELSAAQHQAEQLVDVGVDALIVQDMAYCAMGLNVPLHASTQCALRDAEKVRFFEQTGFSRVVLERAMSIAEIARVREQTTVELEAFVHGAICVSHSGRCYMSRAVSSRSGNRGECSQPCRLAYDLVDADGSVIMRGKHLLSLRDLDMSSHIGAMIDAGVTSFKIEGRLKERDYVRNTVSYYRRLLDTEIARRTDCCRSSVGESQIDFEPNPTKSFSRRGMSYFADGKRVGVASFDTPKSFGELLGRVVEVRAMRIRLDTQCEVSSGDGLCYISDGALLGTNVNRVDGNWIELNRAEGLSVGTEIYRNFDRRFTSAVESCRIKRTIEVDMVLNCSSEKISLAAVDVEGNRAEAAIEGTFDEPRSVSKMYEVAASQLAKCGDTIFRLRRFEVGDLRFVQASILAALRRQVLSRLEQVRLENYRREEPFRESADARYPQQQLTAYDNVTNRLARQFYERHGVTTIEPPLELSGTMEGYAVMTTDYCIRREIGECLRERPTLKGELFLVRGSRRYALEFDCKECRMRVVPRDNG